MIIRIISIAAVVNLLGGCSFSGLSGSSQFACKAPEGVNCNSVSGVYANSLENNLPSQQRGKKEKTSEDKDSYFQNSMDKPQAIRASLPIKNGVSQDNQTDVMPLRSEPKVIRIWIAPYTGAEDEFYDQSYLYTVVDDGRWLIERSAEKIRTKYAPTLNQKTSISNTEPAVAIQGGFTP